MPSSDPKPNKRLPVFLGVAVFWGLAAAEVFGLVCTWCFSTYCIRGCRSLAVARDASFHLGTPTPRRALRTCNLSVSRETGGG